MSGTRGPGMRPVRLAVIGTGAMAASHAKAFKENAGCQIVAAVDLDRKRVEAFCREHGIPAGFTRTADLLAQTACEAVTIVAPDAFHALLSVECLAAGKHVLCEKPLALDYPEARVMVAAARRAGVVNMVNFSYRNWPAIHAVAEVVHSGEIGDLRHVEASYLQSWLPSKFWGDWRKSAVWLWRLSSRHGSNGVLGDVGVHIMDFATYPAGPIAQVYCRLKVFSKAKRDRVGSYVLDANDSAVTAVEFANGALGTIHATRWATGHVNRLYLKISGTRGAVEIDSERSTASYRICSGPDVDRAKWREVEAGPVPTNYERFITAIQKRKAGSPDFSRGAEVQKILDACFKSDRIGRPVRL